MIKKPINIMMYFQIYLLMTIVFFFVGPVQWNINNHFALFFLVITYQFTLYIGYKLGFKKKITRRKQSGNHSLLAKKFYYISLTAFIVNFLYFIRITKLVPNRTVIEVLVKIFTDPRSLYIVGSQNTMSSSQMFGGQLLAIIILLTGPVTVALIPLTIVYYKKMTKTNRIIAIISIIMQILLSVSVGTSEGYINIVIYFFTGFIVTIYNKSYFKRKIKFKSLLFIIIILGVFLVANLLINRNQGSYSLSLGNNDIELSSLYTWLPKKILDGIVYLNIYSTQGYYGMSLAINLPWTPTFGLGFSSYLLGNFQELFNLSIIDMTFLGKAEVYGWGALNNWHTAYTWWANDLYWIGVVPVMLFLGYLLGRTYSDSLYYKDPYAILLLSLLIMSVIFIPANNKVFAAPQTFISFFTYLILYTFNKLSMKWSISR